MTGRCAQEGCWQPRLGDGYSRCYHHEKDRLLANFQRDILLVPAAVLLVMVAAFGLVAWLT